MRTTSPIQVDVHLTPEELALGLLRDAAQGLVAIPKELPPKWFYDDVGCALFDAITRLPEYYPTRREREILYSEAGAVARLTGADTLVELGPGSGEKTMLLLDALAARGSLRRFVPVDVAEPWVRSLCERVADRYPGAISHGVVADFETHLEHLPQGGRRLIAFLGSTIGNLTPARRATMLAALADGMQPGDHLLLGADLVKDVGRLQAAYDDAVGVTAAFNLNMLNVLNRELRATFDPRRFSHVARFDAANEWIEMILRSETDQSVAVSALELEIIFDEGEEMRTEISAKFRRQHLVAELEAAGLAVIRFWTDSRGDFSLLLATPA